MIEWISHWLQTIIIIVLLASFVDLLLPDSSIQKYAKTVLGLLIILTIITPILNIFQQEFSLSRWMQQIEKPGDDEAVQAINRSNIDQESRQQNYQNKMLEQVEKNMKRHLQQLLESRLAVTVTALDIDAEVIDEQWKIHRIEVYVKEKNTSEQDQGKHAITEVESIKVVNINLEQTQAANVQNNEKELTQNTVNKIAALLHEEWGLPQESIVVHFKKDM